MATIHPSQTREVSSIGYLLIIDTDPNSYSTTYSTMLLECLMQSQQRPLVLTFDFTIWIKAVEIVLTLQLPVILQLGGFHLLKSFIIGSIGVHYGWFWA